MCMYIWELFMGKVFGMDRKDKNDLKEPLDGYQSENGAGICKEEEDNDDETQRLLVPSKGGLSKKSGKPRLKVQWNDKNGDKLAEVLEFQPSEASDSDEEEEDSCFCKIM